MARKRQARKCSAHCADGRPCPNYAMTGAKVCKTHGGRAPQTKAAAVYRVAEASALSALHRLGDVERLSNPLEALSQNAAEAWQWKEFLRGQVAELPSLTERTPDGVERPRAVVILYERSLDRCAAITATMAKLNIDDRLYKLNNRIAVAQGERLHAAYKRGLDRLGLTDEQAARAPSVLAEVLQELVA
jgi:hypothetical protein